VIQTHKETQPNIPHFSSGMLIHCSISQRPIESLSVLLLDLVLACDGGDDENQSGTLVLDVDMSAILSVNDALLIKDSPADLRHETYAVCSVAGSSVEVYPTPPASVLAGAEVLICRGGGIRAHRTTNAWNIGSFRSQRNAIGIHNRQQASINIGTCYCDVGGISVIAGAHVTGNTYQAAATYHKDHIVHQTATGARFQSEIDDNGTEFVSGISIQQYNEESSTMVSGPVIQSAGVEDLFIFNGSNAPIVHNYLPREVATGDRVAYTLATHSPSTEIVNGRLTQATNGFVGPHGRVVMPSATRNVLFNGDMAPLNVDSPNLIQSEAAYQQWCRGHIRVCRLRTLSP